MDVTVIEKIICYLLSFLWNLKEIFSALNFVHANKMYKLTLKIPQYVYGIVSNFLSAFGKTTWKFHINKFASFEDIFASNFPVLLGSSLKIEKLILLTKSYFSNKNISKTVVNITMNFSGILYNYFNQVIYLYKCSFNIGMPPLIFS